MPLKTVQISLQPAGERDAGAGATVLNHLGPERLSAFSMMATSILITDKDGIVRFINPAAAGLLGEFEDYLRMAVPGYPQGGPMGCNINVFDAATAPMDGFRKKIGDPKGSIVNMGEVSFGMRLSPLQMTAQEVVGFMVELWDATPEVAIRDQVEHLLHDLRHMARKHMAGETDVFPDPERYEGLFRDVASELTEMVRDHLQVQGQVLDVLEGFSRGDMEGHFPALPGKRAFISRAVETMRANFRGMVAEIARITQAVRQGELDTTIAPERFSGSFRDVVTSFGAMLDTLNTVFSAIGLQVTQSSAAVSQVSSAARELASNSQVQSTSVDEVSASAEETDTQVKANAAAAGQASQLVGGAAAVAAEGKAKVGQMVQAMEGIRASSQDIAKIIRVIDEIAFQTNLLALNAAVEAARAGQHGRGFAVVAQEVRNLAGRSAKAARETGELIESAGARVQAGVKIADETSRAFASIADDISKVQDFMREIAVASDEQARGVAQINAAMSDVAKTALVTSQQADEVAARVAEIEEATARMRDEVSRFRLRPTAHASTNLPALDALPTALRTQILALLNQTGQARA
jgi:methyl-accepting chemotaxis protein